MPAIDINCDMGEGYENDALLMKYISSANIACGYHAGDVETMKRTVDLCLRHGVAIGAHPSYADRENFGRKDMMYVTVQPADIPELITIQLHTLNEVCKTAGAKLHHVKPHGALYNRAAIDRAVSEAICNAVQNFDPSLILYGLSGSTTKEVANEMQITFCNEIFADRRYERDGTLTPRSESKALISDSEECIRQVMQMVVYKTVTTRDGFVIPMEADTLCIHGDGAHAVSFAQVIHRTLTANGISITTN